jgi:hypothetical protein
MARIRLLFLLLLVLGAAAPASAGTTVTVAPSSITASLQATLPVTLVWTVKATSVALTNAAPPPAVLSSPQALISTPGGQILQVVPVPLTVHLAVTGATGLGSVSEMVALTPATLAEAEHLGIETLILSRNFGIKPYAGTGVVTVSVGGSAAGPLALASVSLRFDDRSLVRILHPAESAAAIAEISYTGSGMLNGLWEVATPPSTQGEPVFAPLSSVSVNLAGGGLTEVTSPALPSTTAGAYYLRFRVRNPVVPFASLVLRYAVEASPTETTPIAVIAPESHATLHADTRFEWRPAPDAVAYRLEFFGAEAVAEGTPPLSGQWITASGSAMILSVLAQTHLEPGRLYRWRIVAVNAEREIVGRSALYEIRTP